MKKIQSIFKSIDHTYSDFLIKNGAIAYASSKSGSRFFSASLGFAVAILAIPKASQLLVAYLYQKASSLFSNTSKLKSRNIIATNIGSTTVSTSNALEARLKVSPNMLTRLGKNKQIRSLLGAKAEKKLGKSNVVQITRNVSDITELAGSNDTYQAFLESSISATNEINSVIELLSSLQENQFAKDQINKAKNFLSKHHSVDELKTITESIQFTTRQTDDPVNKAAKILAIITPTGKHNKNQNPYGADGWQEIKTQLSSLHDVAANVRKAATPLANNILKSMNYDSKLSILAQNPNTSATEALNRVISEVSGKEASDNNKSNTDTASPHPKL